MSLWQALFLGALQGATEFLPVSSSGHLVLVPWLLGWQSTELAFGALVHLGTLLSLLIYFWRDLWALILAGLQTLRTRRIETPQQRLAWLIVLATIPGGVAGMLLEDWFSAMFSTPLLVSLLLLVTGALLFAAERLHRGRKAAEDARWGDAALIGLAQAVAIAPGISRSGATMATGLVRGLDRPEAARFSFLLSIPIVAGAGIVELLKTTGEGVAGDLGTSLVAAAAAAVVGFIAVSALLRYLRGRSLMPFAYYCWAFGGLCTVLALLGR
ncbi:MAG: undecaprenyl-diphosphatase UppP [Anaerolineae bacterium]